MRGGPVYTAALECPCARTMAIYATKSQARRKTTDFVTGLILKFHNLHALSINVRSKIKSGRSCGPLLPGQHLQAARAIAMVLAGAALLLSRGMIGWFDSVSAELQFSLVVPWNPR